MKNPSSPYLWLLIIILFLCSLSLQAQTDPPPPPDGGGGPGGVDDVPVDSLLIIGLLFGVLLGYWVLKKLSLRLNN